MSFNKLNVLHWHIVDREAFPFTSERLPLLSQQVVRAVGAGAVEETTFFRARIQSGTCTRRWTLLMSLTTLG